MSGFMKTVLKTACTKIAGMFLGNRSDVFDRVWSCLIEFEGHQTFNQQLKTFLLFSCLMGDLLFVWTPAYQTCLKRAYVPRLLSGLYQLFDLCLIKHVLTVWPLTSIIACLVTKQCLMVFGGQTFIFCPGPNKENRKENENYNSLW